MVAPHRVLIREGLVHRILDNSKEPNYLFLFNDSNKNYKDLKTYFIVLLITHKRNELYHFRDAVPLGEQYIQEFSLLNDKFCMMVANCKKHFMASNAEEAKEWAYHIGVQMNRNTIVNHESIPRYTNGSLRTSAEMCARSARSGGKS